MRLIRNLRFIRLGIAVRVPPVRIADTGDIVIAARLFDNIILLVFRIFVEFFLILRGKGDRYIGSESGKYIPSGIIHVAAGIKLLRQCIDLSHNNIQIRCGQGFLGRIGNLRNKILQNRTNRIQRVSRNGKPAVRILRVLIIILLHHRHIRTETQCSDRHHRVVRRSGNLTLIRHLIAQLIFQNFILINIIQRIVPHDSVRYSHNTTIPF